MRKSIKTRRNSISEKDYRTLAAYRHALRRYLAFSEGAARESGLTPQQYQAMLAIRGHGRQMTIGELAEAMLVRHHSAVELVDRLVRAGLIVRSETPDDRRRVVVTLTARARALLERLAASHLEELRHHGRELFSKLLERLG